MTRLTLLFYFIIGFTGLATAQSTASYHVMQYTTENGLPSNGVKGMQWDEKTNFLWVATEAGIVRFNGVDFNTYTRYTMPQIQSERMLFIVRNRAGNVYFSDMPGNVFLIDKNQPVLWKKPPEKINPFYSNYYLLAVSDSFFNRKSGNTQNTEFSAVTDKISSLSDTSLLLIHNSKLYYQSISQAMPVKLSQSSESFSGLFKIGNESFVRNSQQELYQVTEEGKKLIPVKAVHENGTTFAITSDNSIFWETGMNNPIYIDGTKAWIFYFDGHNITARLAFYDIPADAFIRSVQYSEKNRSLFIGTDSKGLIVLTENRVQSKRRININPKNRNSYYAQLELPDGNILTNEGDVIGNNNGKQEPLPITGKFGFNLSVINDSLIWYFQRYNSKGISCLHLFNKKTGKRKIFDNIKLETIVTNTSRGIYAINNDGILRYTGDSLEYIYTTPQKVNGDLVFDLKEIKPGILFFAKCSGIFSYDIATGKTDTVLLNPNGCIRSIIRYKDYVFFGSYGAGYFIYRNGKIRQMPLDKNKYLLYTHCFVFDDKGFCWISTNRGLFLANADEMTTAFEKNYPEVYYHYFGKKDGMQMTELNGGCTPCALELKNKSISFPSMDGLLLVEPERAVPVLPDGDIFIDEVLADNKPRNIDSLTISSLPAGTQEIIVKAGFSAWCNKENIYLAYQLNDSINWKPVNASDEALIRLIGLPPGDYTLRIRKINGFGKDNYAYKTIRFTIATPWYKQWWFYTLLAGAILCIFFIFYRVRVSQLKLKQTRLEEQVAEKTAELRLKNTRLEKSNSINNRLISIISHDIITPLKFLHVAGKNLLEKKQLMTEELKDDTLKEITTTSRELQLLSTNILNWIKYQHENRRLVKESFLLQDIVSQVFSVLNSMAHQKKLNLVSHVDPGLRTVQYFEPLKILIYNLLTNAIHFAEKGTITTNALETGNHLIISVTDEGIGMTAEQIKNVMADQFIVSSANMDNRKGNGLGYLIIKDLLKMMNATISINSEKGKGTTVYIELPK